MARRYTEYVNLDDEHERIASAIVHESYTIHRDLGPGLLESVYETCLAHKLTKAGFSVQRQVRVPIEYDGLQFPEGYRLDLLVNELVVCELKCVSSIETVHTAQILTYLRLSGKRLGFLVNFYSYSLKYNIKRYVV